MSSAVRTLCLLVVGITVLSLVPGFNAPAAAQTRYLLRVLPFPAAGSLAPMKINEAGQVAMNNTVGGAVAYMWDKTTGIVSLSGMRSAYGINNVGQLIGRSNYVGEPCYVWSLLDGTTILPLGFWAGDINDSGVVCGTVGVYPAAFWTEEEGIVYLPQQITPYTSASGLNNAGAIVGFGYVAGLEHALLWEGGSVTDLGTLGGPNGRSWANEISDAGHIVGYSKTTSGEEHACLWYSGIHDLHGLGVSSRAYDVNSHGRVVGYYSPTPGTARGFIYDAGAMHDLTSLLVNPQTWVISNARSINDLGQIVGTADAGSGNRGVLLTPVPAMFKWVFSAGGAIESSPAIGPDGTIYVGSIDNYLYAVNPDGTVKWQCATGGFVRSSPALGPDGTVYVGSDDCKLHAINPDGTPKWQYATGYISGVLSSPAVGTDGTVYVGSGLSLHAVNPDGTRKWGYATGGSSVCSSPAVAGDGTVYVGSDDHYLHAVNPNGTRKWRFEIGTHGRSSPAIGADGTVYMASGGQLYGINPDGTEKWHIFTGVAGDSLFEPSPAIGPDGTIYFGVSHASRGQYDLHAVRPDGTTAWVITPGQYSGSCPALGADGSIYITFDSCVGPKLRALNPDGTTRWDFETAGTYSSPAIGPNGAIYVGSKDGGLYALQGPAPLAHSPWPMFRRDPAHSGRAARPGDVNRDGLVDIFDVIDTITAFAAVPGDPNWNPGADFDFDGQVTIFDVIDAINNFGTGG